MSDELNKMSDELAKNHGLEMYPVHPLTNNGFTQDINFARRMTHTRSFQAGFDACFEAMSKTHVPKEKVEKLIETLKWYAGQHKYFNYYDAKEDTTVIEHDCGFKAKQALKEFKESEE